MNDIKDKIITVKKQTINSYVFRPMLFSTSMVQAILEGRKTQTRRMCKVQPENGCYVELNMKSSLVEFDTNEGIDNKYCKFSVSIGDIIWVRETFLMKQSSNESKLYIHKADCSSEHLEHYAGQWKPSLFMPKEACRLFLEITNIRVERLNEISKEDAINEGIQPLLMSRMQQIQSGQLYRNYLSKDELFNDGLSAINSYKSLWQKINVINSWSENPFVWVYNFKVIECPERFL